MQVDKGRLLHETLLRLHKLKSGEAVLLQPYKKDRVVCIVLSGEQFHIIEQGFEQNEFTVNGNRLRKLLKTLCKREFPRSKKLWLTILTREEAAGFARHLRLWTRAA